MPKTQEPTHDPRPGTLDARRYVNPNPRIGMLLRHAGASGRLFNLLNPRFGLRGLRWLQKHWPEERLRAELPGYGAGASREWNAILAARPVAPRRIKGFL